jgi:hypothetical protein
MKPVSQGGFPVAKETMDVEVVAGKKHEAGIDGFEFRNPAWAPAAFRLDDPSPSIRITQTERFLANPSVLFSPDTLCRALINTSPSIPKVLGGAGSIEFIVTSLPQPF